MVKNALSRRSHFYRLLEPIFAPKFALVLNMFYTFFFTTFSKNVETHFGTHFGIRVAQEGQDEPKRAIRSFKEPKTFIFKNLKKTNVFLKGFWLQRPLKTASRGRRRLPKVTQKIQDPKNRNPKLIPKIIKKIGTNF